MSAQGIALARGEILGSGEMFEPSAARGAAVRVRSGDERLTPSTLLDLYRRDPVALRQEIERRAHRARNEAICASFARLFC